MTGVPPNPTELAMATGGRLYESEILANARSSTPSTPIGARVGGNYTGGVVNPAYIPPAPVRPNYTGGVVNPAYIPPVPTRPPPVDIAPNRPAPGADPWGVIFGPNVPAAVPVANQGVDTANMGYADLVEWILANYPGLAGFMNIDKDVKNIILQGAREGWTEAQVAAHLESTPWWRRTSESQRQWDLLEETDPAEAKAKVKAAAANLKNASATLGIGLSASELAKLGREAARNGWNSAEQVDTLLKSVNWAKLGTSDLLANRDKVLDEQGRWLVNMPEGTARDYAVRIASGEMTMDGAISQFRKTAKSRFGWMSDLIDQGITPDDYFKPVKNTLAQTLEVGADTINLMDPKWLQLVETRDKDGKMRAATMNEAMMRARRLPQWAKTQQAGDMTAGLVSNLSEMFGRRG